MAYAAAVDLEELATLAGGCNIAHAPDAKDIAALHAQLASSLYHLSATHHAVGPPQNAFSPSNTPTTSSMHRQAPWTSPILEPHAAYGWPSNTPSASVSASASSSSSGTSLEANEDEEGMILDSPMYSAPTALFPPPSARHNGGNSGSGGRPCTPVLPVATTTTNTVNTSMVHPNSTSHPHFQYHHPGHHQLNGTLDTAYDPTSNSFANSDPFYIDLQQQQQQQPQRSRTLQAVPLSFQAQGQAAGYSVQHAPLQYAPLLRRSHAQAHGDAPNPLSSSAPAPSPSNPFGLRPRY